MESYESNTFSLWSILNINVVKIALRMKTYTYCFRHFSWRRHILVSEEPCQSFAFDNLPVNYLTFSLPTGIIFQYFLFTTLQSRIWGLILSPRRRDKISVRCHKISLINSILSFFFSSWVLTFEKLNTNWKQLEIFCSC